MKTVPASSIGDAARPGMGAVFVDGFYPWLKYLSMDRNKLARAFAHMFQLELYHLAVGDRGEILGMAACTNGREPSVCLDGAALRRHLGPFSGSAARLLLKRGLENTDTPFPFPADGGNVEFVSTSARHRGKGIATRLLRDMIAATPYRHYILDVADTNAPAIKVYRRLGFRVILQKRQNPALGRLFGVGALVYMQYTKPPNTGNTTRQ